MTTRTKLGVCIGLMALVAAFALLPFPSTRAPVVSVGFVRYTADRGAVLSFTNEANSPMFCSVRDVFLTVGKPPGSTSQISMAFALAAESKTQMVVWPGEFASQTPREPALFGSTVSFWCRPQRSQLRQGIDVLLSKLGVHFANTSCVATVSLPASMSLNPPTP